MSEVEEGHIQDRPGSQSSPMSETIIYAYGDNTEISDLKDITTENVEFSCKSTPKSKQDNPNPNKDDEEIFVSKKSSVKPRKFENVINIDLLPQLQKQIKEEDEIVCISDDSSQPSPKPTDRQFSSLSPSSGSESYEGTAEVFLSKPASMVNFHNKNKNLPIHSTPNLGLDAKTLVSLCFGECRQICVEKPISVRQNAVFVIDLQKVNKKSLYADDNGSWETACPRKHYKVSLVDGQVDSVIVGNHGNYTHMMRRQYGRHKATFASCGSTFQRIISTIESKDGRECKYGVVQYLLKDCKETDICMAPHGNSASSKRNYYRSDPIVLDKIGEQTNLKPKRAFQTLMFDSEAPDGSGSPSMEPRNMTQIYNVNRSKKVKFQEGATDYGHLFSQIKENDFVRTFSMTADSIQYVLVTDQQLYDVETFCTDENDFSVLSIDTTFDVGKFYITNTCFENTKIVHAEGKYRGKHPLAYGPSFIHNKIGTNEYVTFLSSLLRLKPNLKHIRAIGTDGDESLINACLICFPDSVNLVCCDHKKENIKRKLSEYNISEGVKNHIIADIFGRKIGTCNEKGLIDCTTDNEFDRCCKDFKLVWDSFVPGFHSWFIRHQADIFKLYLIKKVCTKAHIDGRFSNNRIESINDNVKDWVERKKMTMPGVNSEIKNLVELQNVEFEMSLYGSGPFDLSEAYQHLRKERHSWNSMNKTERDEWKNKFWISRNIPARILVHEKPHEFADTGSSGCLSESYLHEKNQDNSSGLSLPFRKEYNVFGISDEFFKSMWSKAEGFRSTPEAIVKAPGFDGCIVMHSMNTKARPHLVSLNKNGTVSCNDCEIFQATRCCSHSLAGADFLGGLQTFVKKRKASKSTESVASDILFSNITGGRKKSSKPRRGGRTSLTNKERPEHYIERPRPVSDDTDNINMLDNLCEENSYELLYLFQTKALKCYGCSEKFDKEKEHNHLVIRAFCEREFTRDGEKKKKWQNAYFHLKITCVKRKFPDFVFEHVKLAKEIENVMSEDLKSKLLSLGVVSKNLCLS